MLTHTSRQGSFINTDGFIQFSSAFVEDSSHTKSLLALCAEILEDGVFTCKEVWEKELLEKFPYIDSARLLQGKKIQEVKP